MNQGQLPSETEQTSESVEQLEHLYHQHFTPPVQQEESAGLFKQATLFDYSIATYCSDSTQGSGKPSAELE